MNSQQARAALVAAKGKLDAARKAVVDADAAAAEAPKAVARFWETWDQKDSSLAKVKDLKLAVEATSERAKRASADHSAAFDEHSRCERQDFRARAAEAGMAGWIARNEEAIASVAAQLEAFAYNLASGIDALNAPIEALRVESKTFAKWGSPEPAPEHASAGGIRDYLQRRLVGPAVSSVIDRASFGPPPPSPWELLVAATRQRVSGTAELVALIDNFNTIATEAELNRLAHQFDQALHAQQPQSGMAHYRDGKESVFFDVRAHELAGVALKEKFEAARRRIHKAAERKALGLKEISQ